MGRLNQNGGAILLAVISILLVGIVSTVAFQHIDNYSRDIASTNQVLHRDQLATKLRRMARTPIVLYKSLDKPANAALLGCMIDDSLGAVTPNDCDANTWSPLSLADESGDKLLTGGTPQTAGGFDSEGKPCQGGDRVCSFMVHSEFKPSCTGGAVSCKIARTMELRFEIRPTRRMVASAPMPVSQVVLVWDGTKGISRPGMLVPTTSPDGAGGDDSGGGGAGADDDEVVPPPPRPPPVFTRGPTCPSGSFSFMGRCIRFGL